MTEPTWTDSDGMVITVQVHSARPEVRLSVMLGEGTYNYDIPAGAARVLAEGIVEACGIIQAREN